MMSDLDVEKCLDGLLASPDDLSRLVKENPQKLYTLLYAVREDLVAGDYKESAQTKEGDTLVLYVDKENQQYSVSYCGLAGFDDVEFKLDSAGVAVKLFDALQHVTETECD